MAKRTPEDAERLAAALRANLHRRKAQARAQGAHAQGAQAQREVAAKAAEPANPHPRANGSNGTAQDPPCDQTGARRPGDVET